MRRERSRRGSVQVVHDRSRYNSQQNRELISEEYIIFYITFNSRPTLAKAAIALSKCCRS